jgi:glycosyltransferase involved in cell wall biosynthesis
MSIIYQSASNLKINFKKKKKIISFVGKLNKAKGYDIFCDAITTILDKYPDWSAAVFGDEPREEINVYHKKLKVFGFKKHSHILNFLKKTSISVVCSRWNEPFGRTSLEAASRGSAVIITNRGGLPETTNYGIILKKLNSKLLIKKLESLIKDDDLRKKIQIKTYNDFKFTHSNISKEIDNLRKNIVIILPKHNTLERKKSLKILHITNFNERHDGRLHYNTGKRINNGFIRLGHNVLQISDRDIVSNYRNITDPKGSITLNNKIVKSYNNFKPDLIVMGHADNVLSSTLSYLKNINNELKICQWFLDPVTKFGPDFENNKRRILDKINFLDASFLTTDPKSLSFQIKNSYFIPNPADSSFETLENYKSECENDLFFAMSHGVHRGTLKTGKNDDREKILKKLIKVNSHIKFDFYGIEKQQPIWGDNFVQQLSKSKMALNLSRGKPIKYYSSDRLAQLMGNGLLTFIDAKTEYSDFFNKNELITYSDFSDLNEKINRYKKNDKQRKSIARNGRLKYLKYFNSNLVAQFIIDKTFEINKKNKYIWN